jgi:uncharacterized membrane protein
MKAKDVSITVVFAALYAIGVVALAPISFHIYQVRLADALLPLSMIFGLPSAIGLSLGTIVANVYGGLGIIDIIGGTAANFVACTLAWLIARRRSFLYRLVGAFTETIIVTVIVGGYLSLIFDVPLEFGLFGILVGSLIAINILGFPIEETVRRSGVTRKYGYAQNQLAGERETTNSREVGR